MLSLNIITRTIFITEASHMNTTTIFRKRNIVLFVTDAILIDAILIVAVLVSASAIGRPMNITGTMVGDNSNRIIL